VKSEGRKSAEKNPAIFPAGISVRIDYEETHCELQPHLCFRNRKYQSVILSAVLGAPAGAQPARAIVDKSGSVH
jgi:hypothetical protein